MQSASTNRGMWPLMETSGSHHINLQRPAIYTDITYIVKKTPERVRIMIFYQVSHNGEHRQEVGRSNLTDQLTNNFRDFLLNLDRNNSQRVPILKAASSYII